MNRKYIKVIITVMILMMGMLISTQVNADYEVFWDDVHDGRMKDDTQGEKQINVWDRTLLRRMECAI